jgi:hypothetical protein
MSWRRAPALVLYLSSLSCSRSLRYADVLPRFRPGRLTRECHVHKCNVTTEDAALDAANKCSRMRGHMQPMGQQSDMMEVPRVSVTSSAEFYETYVAGSKPVVLAGAAAAAIGGVDWNDEFLLRSCMLDSGRPWPSIIEVNKVVITNTRWPLMDSKLWNFCEFIKNYTRPQHSDGLYSISPLGDPGVQLGRAVNIPSVLRCSELYESSHDTRLWMSSGGTSSSLHFDTHENLMLQIDGSKEVFFWPPSESHMTYMDYHDRFGLSPVNPDRVDLEKFPLFASMRGGMTAHLQKGDALLIPDGWWHQVRTRPGRNVAVTWEFEPYEGVEQLWPGQDAFKNYMHENTWSMQVRIKYANKKLVTVRHGAIACNESVAPTITADTFKCSDNNPTAASCNFKCIPQTCVTQQMMEKEHGFFYSG